MPTPTKILSVFIFLLSCFLGMAQAPAPSGLPAPYSTGYYRIGWIQADSGMIPGYRDTFWIPKFQGTEILWMHAGSDTSKWMRVGNRWIREAKFGDIPLLVGVSPIVVSGDSISCPTCGSGSGGITQLTGDGTAGPGSGSQSFILSTVNANVGSFGDASHVPDFTVNGKGLLTAAGQVSIQIAESQVTNLVSDLAGKQPTITTGSTSQYFRGDLSLATFPTDLSSFTNGPSYIKLISLSALVPAQYNNLTGVISVDTLTGSQNLATQGFVTRSLGTSINGSGNLSPLFTTSIVSNTLIFTASNAGANTVFGNFTGSAAPAAFGKLTLGAMATNTANTLLGYDGSGNAADVTVGNASPLFTTAVTSGVLTFTLNNVSSYAAFGNFTNSTAMPSFSKIPIQAMATNSPNNLFGWDGSGNPTTTTLTLGYSQNATNNTLSITDGNTATFLVANATHAGLIDSAHYHYLDSLFLGLKFFNLYAVNGLSPLGNTLPNDSIGLCNGCALFQNVNISGSNAFSFILDSMHAASGHGFKINFGSDAGWDMFTKDSVTGFMTRIAKGTPGQSLQMLAGGGIGWAAQAGGGGSDSAIWKNSATYTGNQSLTMVGFSQAFNGGKVTFDSVDIVEAFPKSDSVVFFDNSIGSGTGASSLPFRYQQLLVDKLRRPMADYSVSGTSMQVDGLAKIPLIPHYGTNHAFLVIGYIENDINNVSNFGTWDTAHCGPIYRQFVDTAIARGWPANKIILRGPVWTSPTNFPNATLARQAQYDAMVSSVATTLGCIFVEDFNSFVYRGTSILYFDQVLHPNNTAHSLLANLIYNAMGGDSARSDGTQGFLNNRTTDINKLVYHGHDTLSNKAVPLSVDTNGKIGAATADQFLENSTTLAQAQAFSGNITGTFAVGNGANTAFPASVQFFTPGTIQGGSLRINAGPPAGWSGAGLNFSYSGGAGHIYNYTYPGGPAGNIYINELAGAIVAFNTSTPTGGPEVVQINGGMSATFGRFEGAVAGSGITGSAVEVEMSGTTGFAYAYNRTGSVGLNFDIGAGLSPLVIIGPNIVTGTAPFQVQSAAYFSGNVGLGQGTPVSVLEINRNISSPPSTGEIGGYFSSDTSTITFNAAITKYVDHFFGHKTINQTSAHAMGYVYNTEIERDIIGTNNSATRDFSLNVIGGVYFRDSVLIGGLKTGTSSDSVVVWNATDSSLKKIAQSSLGGGVTTVGSFSGSSQTNGASISGSTITFGPADGTNPGMIKASGSQTLGPALTLNGQLNITGGITGSIGTATDANYTVGSESEVHLVQITANRSVTMPTPSSFTGRWLVISNYNTSAFNWTFPATVVDATGTGFPISVFPNGATVNLYSDGTNWLIRGVQYSMTVLVSGGWQVSASTTASTISNNITNYLINPASLIATYTLTLPSNPIDAQVIKIHFGGTITSGAVITALTISPNSGQSITGSSITTAAVSSCYIYTYNAALASWYREQ